MTSLNTSQYFDSIVAQIAAHHDISDGAVDRAIAHASPLPQDLAWVPLLPNGFTLNWREITMRERAFLVSTIKYLIWDNPRDRKVLLLAGSEVAVLASVGAVTVEIIYKDVTANSFVAELVDTDAATYARIFDEQMGNDDDDDDDDDESEEFAFDDLAPGMIVDVSDPKHNDSMHTQSFSGDIHEINGGIIYVNAQDGVRFAVRFDEITRIEA